MKATLEIEVEEECLLCPNLELETQNYYSDMLPIYKFHQCKHVNFCKGVRSAWEQARSKSEP